MSKCRIEGGYHIIKSEFIRSGIYKHTAAHPEGISDLTLEAANILGETAWRVNTFVGDLMLELWEAGQTLGGLPDPNPPVMPGRIPDDIWESMTEDEKKEHRFKLVSLHEEAAKSVSGRESFIRKLDLYKQLRDEPRLYYPHFIDFRTRLYPLPQDLHPQGDQLAKALLEFSEGKPLGPDGLNWLKIKLANSAGQDKLSLEDRMAWVDRHHREIVDSARNPLDGWRFWASPDFDEPWVFLATAKEYADATAMLRPEEYVSHQPIPLDGSTNGLQHLAMMGRDEVGARLTNCTSSPDRYDLYSEVAASVQKLVTHDAVDGEELAHLWISKGINRKTVKRAVMTTPYGVTDVGIRDQLIKDGHCDGMDSQKFQAATYMKDKIKASMSEAIESAAKIMAWLQETAAALAEAGQPLVWTSPSGSRCVQAYYRLASKKVSTLLGTFTLWSEDRPSGLDPRKQYLSAAPNIIHSFDAAHLQMTVVELAKRGVTDFAMIHDSYATHAANTTLLSKVLREQAYEIYKDDWLQKLHQEFLDQSPPGVELPEPPSPGSYDPKEVLNAPYFFS